MTRSRLNTPEPSLPEHLLIQDAAPLPELSSGLKARVMTDCSASIAGARRAFRLKVTAGLATFCCLGVLFCLAIPQPEASSMGRGQHQKTSGSYAETFNYSSGTRSLAGDKPVAPVAETEGRQTDELIETLNSRSQDMLDANIFPKF